MKKILLILLVLLVSGCSDYTELTDLGIISSILIDYKDKYYVTIEYLDKDDLTNTVSCSSNTISDAINICNNNIDKRFSYNHLNTVFITENINIEELVYFFLRDPEINNNFYLALVNNDNIFNKEKNIGSDVLSILKENNYDDFFSIMESIVNKNKDINIPIYDDGIKGIALYKDNKINMILNKNESNIFTLLNNNNSINIYNVCDDDFFSLNINDIKVDYIIDKNIKVYIKAYSSISELTCNVDTTKKEDIVYLEKIASDNLKGNITYMLNLLSENKINSLGINKLINNKYKDLNTNFYNYPYEVDVDLKIFKKGLLLK